jgi:hypothetical protein
MTRRDGTRSKGWDNFTNDNLSQFNARSRNKLGEQARGTGHFR